MVIKIEQNFDVIVCGGGVAGISAAVSASKLGAKVALVERYGYLGGQATGGMVMLFVGLTDGKQRIIKGFCEETLDELTKLGNTKKIGNHILTDVETMKFCFDEMLKKYNITPFFHSFISGVETENDKIKGIYLEGKSGKRFLQGKTFVDATGDADLAKYAQIPFEQTKSEQILPTTLCFRAGGVDTEILTDFLNSNYKLFKNILENLGISTSIGGFMPTLNPKEVWFNVSNINFVDITNSNDLTMAEIKGRKQIQEIMKEFKQKIKGMENSYLIDTASQIGGRESRRIKGTHQFRKDDIEKTFMDKIALAPNYKGGSRGFVEVPFSILTVAEYTNLAFAGRCISTEHDLIDMFREIPCCMATGQASGVACAISSKTNQNIKNVDITTLQKELRKQNTMLEID